MPAYVVEDFVAALSILMEGMETLIFRESIVMLFPDC